MQENTFLDVGCSSGGSLAWGAKFLGGEGLGIDIDPKKVERSQKAGQNAIVADATHLNFADGAFKFALFFDMLEHLPNVALAEKCIREAYRVSREFVLIRGPNFDAESALRGLGLKRYYEDWTGHTWHHKASDFQAIIRTVRPVDALVVAHHQITSPQDPDLLPINAPADQATYDLQSHGPKPNVQLPGRIFTRIIVVLSKSKDVNMHQLANLAMGNLIYPPVELSDR